MKAQQETLHLNEVPGVTKLVLRLSAVSQQFSLEWLMYVVF